MKKLVLALTLLTAHYSQAQKYIGLSTSNWSGTYAIGLNPANIADSRTRFALDLYGVNLGIDNSLAKVNLNNAFSGAGGGGDATLGNVLQFTKNKAFNFYAPIADIRLPGIMVSIDNKNSIALTTRVRFVNQFNHFDQNLLRSLLSPDPNGSDVGITSQNFNWTFNTWSEVKLTYAREVYNEGNHYIKAGISLNRLGGLGYLGIKGKNLDGHYYAAQDSIHTNSTDLEFATNLASSGSDLYGGLGDVFGQFFGKKAGSGFGLDLGAVYEYRTEETNSDDQSDNKYKVRGSIAVTDMGSIKYKTSFFANVTASGSMSTKDFADNIGNYSNFSSYAASRGYHLDTGVGTIKVHTPASLVMNVDYYVASHFYVNALWIKNVANRMNFGNSIYGQFTVTPRWDNRYVTLALPITYSAMTSSLKAGLGVRLGGLYFGSDDMLLMITGKGYGANFYSGVYIPINKKHKKASKLATGVVKPS